MNKKLIIKILVLFIFGIIIGSTIDGYLLKVIKKIKFNSALHVNTLNSEEYSLNQIELNTRTFTASGSTEKEGKHINTNTKINLNKTALLLMDVWENHPIKEWEERAKKNIKNKIIPLLSLARQNNIKIIHAPHNKEINKNIKPLKKELVISTQNLLQNTSEFDKFLKKIT